MRFQTDDGFGVEMQYPVKCVNFGDWAEFLRRVPMDIPGGAKVNHYGKTVRVACEQKLHALV